MGLPDLVNKLEKVLGKPLVAVIAGAGDSKIVGKWSRGERVPRPEAEHRLRVAFQIMHVLLQRESPEIIYAWFTGMNPDLDNASPALYLAKDPDEVVIAARNFLAYG